MMQRMRFSHDLEYDAAPEAVAAMLADPAFREQVCDALHVLRHEVSVPLIASGGAGRVEHFAPAVEAGADAVLAASVFHFGDLEIGQVKDSLREHGYPVR